MTTRGRDNLPGIRAADDPDIDVLAEILRRRLGPGRKADPDRWIEARRLLRYAREFQNATAPR